MKLEIKNLKDLPFTTWSGGTTTQLFIKPENFTVKDDFDIRISSATIEPGDSTFSDFSKYNRFLTILDGWIDIAHPSEDVNQCEGKRLERHIPYYFDGAIKPISSSTVKVIDFNVIWKKSLAGVEVKIFDFSKNTKEQIKFLSETIDDFRDFFNPNKHKMVFEIKDAIEKSLKFMGNQFEINKIKVNVEYKDEKVYGIETELEQVILNILNNSMDAFKEREIENKEINIKVLTKQFYTILIMEDNAGGVKEESLEKLFDPYYTTKATGTGTGLYMVKLVIKNSFQGDLKINNSEKGLRYIMALPQKEEI